jgi:hypothetical protein
MEWLLRRFGATNAEIEKYAASNDPVEIAVKNARIFSRVSNFIFDLTKDILAVANFMAAARNSGIYILFYFSKFPAGVVALEIYARAQVFVETLLQTSKFLFIPYHNQCSCSRWVYGGQSIVRWIR